jgi:hypothetical protein
LGWLADNDRSTTATSAGSANAGTAASRGADVITGTSHADNRTGDPFSSINTRVDTCKNPELPFQAYPPRDSEPHTQNSRMFVGVSGTLTCPAGSTCTDGTAAPNSSAPTACGSFMDTASASPELSTLVTVIQVCALPLLESILHGKAWNTVAVGNASLQVGSDLLLHQGMLPFSETTYPSSRPVAFCRALNLNTSKLAFACRELVFPSIFPMMLWGTLYWHLPTVHFPRSPWLRSLVSLLTQRW